MTVQAARSFRRSSAAFASSSTFISVYRASASFCFCFRSAASRFRRAASAASFLARAAASAASFLPWGAASGASFLTPILPHLGFKGLLFLFGLRRRFSLTLGFEFLKLFLQVNSLTSHAVNTSLGVFSE